MPPNTASSSAGNIPKEAAKNALIFSLVEQAVGRQKLSRPNDIKKLEIASQAISLYDKHVDTLGHNACMDAVKRYLEEQGFGPKVEGGGVKIVDDDHAKVQHTPFQIEQSFMGSMEGMHKHKALQFNSVMKYVGKLAGERHYGAEAKFYKLNLKHVIDAYPGAGKLEKGHKLSRKDKAERLAKNIPAYFQRLRHILNGHADGTNARDENLFVKKKVKTDKAIMPWIESGRHFFHPVGYKRMKSKDKKEARHNVTNWSNEGTAEEYKKHLQEVKAMKTSEGMIYVPDLSKNWATMSGQAKYEYVTKKKDGKLVHWHMKNKEEYISQKKAMMMKADGM
jgi:hypothetical protein